jgi:serine O-acetyltransferase
MILNKKDYLYYLEADRIALGREKMNFKMKIKEFIYPDYIWKFQRLLRETEYYGNTKETSIFKKVYYLFLKVRFLSLSIKLGFTIPENVFGPGLAIVHYGTIVVNGNSKIGANCRIHANTNIGESGGLSGAPIIGDNVYIAPGVKIYGRISIASNTAIAANTCVGSSFYEENFLIGGIPAKTLKQFDIKQIIKHI